MIQRLLTYINLGNLYHGLEIYQTGDQYHYSLIKVKKRKQELLVEEELESENLEAVIGHLKPSIPLFLSFNTKGVITKDAGGSKQAGKDLANSLFPNMDFNTLFYEAYHIKNHVFVSITKKKDLEEILAKLEKTRVSVFSFHLGLSGIAPLAGYLPVKEIMGTTYILSTFESDQIKVLMNTPQSEQRTYELNGLPINSKFLLAFGAIISSIQNRRKNDSNFLEVSSSKSTEFTNKRRLSLLVRFALITFLMVLLLNFIAFDHYFKKVENLTEEIALNKTQLERFRVLKEKVDQREARLGKALSSSNSNVSFYFDQIAEILPSSISFDQWLYQPMPKPKRDNKPIEYEYGKMMIIGETNNRADFTNWLSKIEELNWTSNIETLEFDYLGKNNSMFKLSIGFADENQ
nr:hypothetical protein [Allomuricauda sp.]